MNILYRRFHSAVSVCYEKFKPSDIYISSWRKPLIQPPPTAQDFTNNNEKWSLRNVLDNEWRQKFVSDYSKNQQIKSQRISYVLEQKVGRDIAAAYFVVRVGGSAKFAGKDRLYKKKSEVKYNSELPKEYMEDYILEEVYLDDVKVYYEGLDNFRDIPTLKVLSFANNPEVNDWYIDFICGEIPSVMYLDISKCKNVTYRGITSLYRLKHLKVLNVSEISNNADFKYACLELENDFPGINVVGIDVAVPESIGDCKSG